MPRDTQLSKMLNRPDPLLNFRWVAETLPFGDEYGIGPEYVETFEIPFNNVKSEGIFNAAGMCYFPGFHDITAFNVTFYADSQGKTLKYLLGWKDRIKNFQTGIYYLPSNFKRDWRVILLDAKGNDVLRATLRGCWPADTNQLQLQYASSEKVELNQNFSVDDITY
jgi:hypothetical protein